MVFLGKLSLMWGYLSCLSKSGDGASSIISVNLKVVK
jgi:hypothetical protein